MHIHLFYLKMINWVVNHDIISILVIKFPIFIMTGVELTCKVCNAICNLQTYDSHRSCESCRQFYNRSVRKMARWVAKSKLKTTSYILTPIFRQMIYMIEFFTLSSSSFSYYCTCVEGCWSSESIKCTIDSSRRNACKQCRYIKLLNLQIYIPFKSRNTSITHTINKHWYCASEICNHI